MASRGALCQPSCGESKSRPSKPTTRVGHKRPLKGQPALTGVHAREPLGRHKIRGQLGQWREHCRRRVGVRNSDKTSITSVEYKYEPVMFLVGGGPRQAALAPQFFGRPFSATKPGSITRTKPFSRFLKPISRNPHPLFRAGQCSVLPCDTTALEAARLATTRTYKQ